MNPGPAKTRSSSESSDSKTSSRTSRPWQPRFGLRGTLLLMLVVSVMGTAGNYLVMALREGRSSQLVFILFTLAAPLLMLVAVSVLYAVFHRRR